MEAPEKLYFAKSDLAIFDIYSVRESDDEIVYTRTDALIEKAINFLNYKLDDVVAIQVSGTIIPRHVAKQELIEDLEKYMKEYMKGE